MPPQGLGRAAARWRRSALVALVLGVAPALYLGTGPHRRAADRLLADAGRHGWQIVGGTRHDGLFATTLGGSRLRTRDGRLTGRLERIAVEHWFWRAQRVTVAGVQAELEGDPVAWLRELTAARAWLANTELTTPLTLRVRHRLLGSVDLDGVTVRTSEAGLTLHADRIDIGGRQLAEVTLLLEPRNESFVVRVGNPTGPRAEVTLFPAREGTAHWIVDLPHQPVRPLGAGLGWGLGAEHDAARIAGSISFDLPDDPAVDVRGRTQLIVDGWPSGAPDAAAPILGDTFSLAASLVPRSRNGGWEFPRVEVKQRVFTLTGQGTLDAGTPPRLLMAAHGERTCRELRALLPPSQARDRVERFVTTRHGGSGARAGLTLRWDAVAASWTLEPGCGLEAWTAAGN